MRNLILSFFCVSACFLLEGCVQRRLTINTVPAGALVVLNDEEIGTSPVTTNFDWYGDFSVRISKDGYQTLNTHRKLKRPIKDVAPFDFFWDLFSNRVDEYTWDFTLEPYKEPDRNELIQSAQKLKAESAEPEITKKKKNKK